MYEAVRQLPVGRRVQAQRLGPIVVVVVIVVDEVDDAAEVAVVQDLEGAALPLEVHGGAVGRPSARPTRATSSEGLIDLSCSSVQFFVMAILQVSVIVVAKS